MAIPVAHRRESLDEDSDAPGDGARLFAPTSPATRRVWLMILAWSVATHVASPGRGTMAGPFEDAGVPSRGVSEDDLEDMMPIEPLWDVLLPLFGLSVGIFGVQLTLGLSIAEPLLLLLLPWLQQVVHALHHSLVGWHLGGIFGHPVLVAQVIAHRSERRRERRTAAFGALVGAYGLGAVIGAGIRRQVAAASPHDLVLRRALRGAVVFALVSCNLVGVVAARSLFEAGHGAAASPTRGSPIGVALVESLARSLEHAALTMSGDAAPLLPLAPERLALAKHRLAEAAEEFLSCFYVAAICGYGLIARALVFFSLTAIMGPVSLPTLDLVPPLLGEGLRVQQFDLICVLASCVLVPVALGPVVACTGERLLSLCFQVAFASCSLAVLATSRGWPAALLVTSIAGMALSVLAAVASATLSAHALECVPGHHAGVALGWGLLANGLAQFWGVRIGERLFACSGWQGLTAVAWLACAAAWVLTWPRGKR